MLKVQLYKTAKLYGPGAYWRVLLLQQQRSFRLLYFIGALGGLFVRFGMVYEWTGSVLSFLLSPLSGVLFWQPVRTTLLDFADFRLPAFGEALTC